MLVTVDRRTGEDRRQADRREHETARDHIRSALGLLENLAEAGALDDELQRDLDSAIFRLRFALDRLERP